MFFDCICQMMGMDRPSVQEILERIQENTVCTGVQCFETEQDAFGIVPHHAPSPAHATDPMFYAALAWFMALAIWAFFHTNHRTTLTAPTAKPIPQRPLSHRDDDMPN